MRPKSSKPVPPAPPAPPYRLPDTFVAAIRDRIAAADADAEPGEPPWMVHADAWLGACVLDDAGVAPEELLSGSWHIRTNDAQLTGPVALGIRGALGGRATGDDDWPGAGQVAVGTPSCRGGTWYRRALELACPTVAVSTHGEDAKPAEAPALADRHVDLRQPDYPRTLAAVIAAATGGGVGSVVVNPAECEGMGWPDVQLVLHPGTTAAEALDRVRRLGRVRRGQWQDARDEVADVLDLSKAKRGVTLVKPEYPVPLAQPAADVVKRLADMAGFGDDARRWGMALADDLRDYRHKTLGWRDVDKGILLSGPPGSGKTTFARALALECECELVTTVYSDWSAAGGSVGETMTRGLTKLFEGWRKKAGAAPIILFIDEVDTMGRRGGNDHNESWFTAVINSWLAFLDGAIPRDGIVVVGATNYPDRIDPALLRAGRLDRHVILDAPSHDALAGVLRAHLGDGADLSDLGAAARACRGLSPAEVGLVVRDARRMARRTFRRPVRADDVTLVLRARRERDRDPGTERRVAIHEAGHAVGILALGVERLEYVDLDTRLTGSRLPEVMTRVDVEARVAGLLCGMAAEATVYGEHSAGNSLDLREGTNLAASLHAAWAMGDTVAALPDALIMGHAPTRAAIEATVSAAHRRALALLAEHRDAVERLADALVERRYLDASEVREVVGSRAPSPACG